MVVFGNSLVLVSRLFRVVVNCSNSRMLSSVKEPLDFIVQPNDILMEKKTHEFCQKYNQLPFEKKIDVLKELSVKYDFDKRGSKTAAESFLSLQSKEAGVLLNAADRLHAVLTPSYAHAFNRIRRTNGGVKFIVDLRADILKAMPSLNVSEETTDHLKALNKYLKEILAFSFNVGFLKLERITWDSSCHMLEKISQYEAVHPVRSWTDVKQRVGPYRRCYVFTHSSMPKEPIVILHTALMQEISSSISSIVRQQKPPEDLSGKPNNEVEDPNVIKAAVFYSITSTHKGLHGIELGNQLIKKVVQEVLVEFPKVSLFSSLSPIPGFKTWLLLEIKKIKTGNSVIKSFFSEQEQSTLRDLLSCMDSESMWQTFQSLIASNRWVNDEAIKEFLKTLLMKLCAHYLYTEKRRAYALNSVAHFHLRNGAVLWRLNWLADLSPRGLDNSCGMMVNYRYYLDETEKNGQNYIENHVIQVSEDVRYLSTPTLGKSSL